MNLVYDVAHNIAKFEEHDDRRPTPQSSGCIARGRRGPFRPAIAKCPSNIAASASR